MSNNNQIWISYKFPYQSFDLSLCQWLTPFIEKNIGEIANFNYSTDEKNFTLYLFIDREKSDYMEAEIKNLVNNEVIAKPKPLPELSPCIIAHCDSINRIICDSILDFYKENGEKINYTIRLGYAVQLSVYIYKIAGISINFAKLWSAQNYEESVNLLKSSMQKIEEGVNVEDALKASLFIIYKMDEKFKKNKDSMFGLIKKVWNNDYIPDFAKKLYEETERIKIDSETRNIEIEALKVEKKHSYTSNVYTFFLKNAIDGVCNKLGLYAVDNIYLHYALKEAMANLFETENSAKNNKTKLKQVK